MTLAGNLRNGLSRVGFDYASTTGQMFHVGGCALLGTVYTPGQNITFSGTQMADFVTNWSKACFTPDGKFTKLHCTILSPVPASLNVYKTPDGWNPNTVY